VRERKVKEKEADLIKILSKVGPRNIVRVDLASHFRWPELREIRRQDKEEGKPFEEGEWE
jgi:hypothetical protein